MLKKSISRRRFLKYTSLAFSSLSIFQEIQCVLPSKRESLPNFIIIFCDDLGYGDVGCFGSEIHKTPNIDQMVEQGMKLTSFYVSSGVCTPSRASLLTGCYPRRVGMHMSSLNECVLFPVAEKGLSPNEITIAELLKKKNYATACIGKWHLGDQKEFLPTKQGFDSYFGIPYSNDMGAQQRPLNPPLPLMQNEEVIEAPVNQNTITKRYTEEAIKFITENKDNPFFLYFPHSMPHNPVHASEAFKGKSLNNGYGDAVEEIDWSTGEILKTLRNLGIDTKTLVIFTSDNGAAQRWGGSNAPLSGWKGSTWEGGMRVPCIVRWPGKIPANSISDQLTITMDLLPTFAKLAGLEVPKDRIIDGKDIWPILSGTENTPSPHEAFYYYLMDQLQAIRSGKWKLHLPLENKKKNWGKGLGKVDLKLFDLQSDVQEKTDVSRQYPEVVARLLSLADQARIDLGDLNQKGLHQRDAAVVINPKPLVFRENFD